MTLCAHRESCGICHSDGWCQHRIAEAFANFGAVDTKPIFDMGPGDMAMITKHGALHSRFLGPVIGYQIRPWMLDGQYVALITENSTP
jgi:hypothetical protein